MTASTIARERPVRWDHPLDRDMLSRDVSWLLAMPPFQQLNPVLFEANGSLETILRHDARILRYDPGDVIIREGDYGSSAFIVLRGSVRAFLVSLWEKKERAVEEVGVFAKILRLFGAASFQAHSSDQNQEPIDPNEKRQNRNRNENAKSRRQPVQAIEQTEGRNRIFLQDIESVVNDYKSEPLGAGKIFGEMAAITRTPHRFSVVADAPCVVLEIRWQGLRLLRKDPEFRKYLDERYKSSGLETHLRETPLFRFLDEDTIRQVVGSVRLDSHGEMEWFADYKSMQGTNVAERIQREPLIAAEGTPAKDLYLIRAGFARLSFEHGHGHQTTAYLGRGQMFGLEEIADSFRNPNARPLPFQQSLRALGFVDLLRIPRDVVLKTILPNVRKSELPPSLLKPRYDAGGLVVPDLETMDSTTKTDTPLVEFLVDQRLINGQQTMLIDLDRCTGCDECVKACATTHQGTPRFVRTGPQYNSLLFTHACMHCVDPVCMIGCPTGAIHRNADTGIISINADTCIGCKTCAESCPYENIVMIELKDRAGKVVVDNSTKLPLLQASKCDLCQDLRSGPACQNACPHQALFRIDTSHATPLQRWIDKKAA